MRCKSHMDNQVRYTYFTQNVKKTFLSSSLLLSILNMPVKLMHHALLLSLLTMPDKLMHHIPKSLQR